MNGYRLIRETWKGFHALPRWSAASKARCLPTRVGSIGGLLLLFSLAGAAAGCATVNPGQTGVLWRASSGNAIQDLWRGFAHPRAVE